eukprot:8256146-Alexandrium_andersonii.AAC.1
MPGALSATESLEHIIPGFERHNCWSSCGANVELTWSSRRASGELVWSQCGARCGARAKHM